MHRRGRRGLAVGVGLMAAVLLALAVPASVAGAAPVTTGDPAGDTITDADDDRIDSPKADIVASWADLRSDAIALGLRVRQAVDPKKDANWSSDATFITWELDVTGDGKRDYEVEYSLDAESKELVAFVDRYGGDEPDLVCEPPASYSADAGYSVVVDRNCLGNPAGFSYKVTLNYDTDVEDENAAVATDVVPNQGSAPATSAPPPALQAPPAASPATPAKVAPAPQATAANPTPSAQGPGPRGEQSPAPSAPPPVSGSILTGPSTARASAGAPATAGNSRPATTASTGSGQASPRSSLAIGGTSPQRQSQLAGLASALILADLVFLRTALRRRAAAS